jgi:hypothetical protein
MKKFFKFGVCYNIFDGEELLEDSILHIRGLVDIISVVYQTESYWGNKCTPTLVDTLNRLKKEGLIDELVFYKNNPILTPHTNQIIKRNMGIDISRKRYCTHHMSMDCDEFYVEEQFNNMLDWYEENDNYVGFADYNDYYKSPSYLIDKPHDTMVSLFFPIRDINTRFIQDYHSPVLVDPTRRPNYDKYIVFQQDFIQMHHMTLVRKNIDSKVRNAAKRLNYNTEEAIQKQVDYYNNWTEDNLVGLNEWGNLKLKKIEPVITLTNFNK